MKAAVVTQDHQVDVTEKTLRPLRHGEALAENGVLRRMPYRSTREKRRFR
nr:alcohol dehydrogenase [Salmonella sp. NCTC 7297]